jgi:hypothetical protein
VIQAYNLRLVDMFLKRALVRTPLDQWRLRCSSDKADDQVANPSAERAAEQARMKFAGAAPTMPRMIFINTTLVRLQNISASQPAKPTTIMAAILAH